MSLCVASDAADEKFQAPFAPYATHPQSWFVYLLVLPLPEHPARCISNQIVAPPSSDALKKQPTRHNDFDNNKQRRRQQQQQQQQC